MSHSGSKHVQTRLTEDEYESFREFAEERDMTVTDAGHEAILEWIVRQQRVDPDDRAFTVLEELDDPLPDSARTDARGEADLAEDWSGDDAEFDLADEPSARH
jgi:hypothetical protein